MSSPQSSPRPRKMPPSPRTQGRGRGRRLYAQLSSIVEGSFYDGMDISVAPQGKLDEQRTTNLAHIAPSNAVTDSIRLQDDAKGASRPVVSFVVVYTMIFFNGCEWWRVPRNVADLAYLSDSLCPSNPSQAASRQLFRLCLSTFKCSGRLHLSWVSSSRSILSGRSSGLQLQGG